MMLGIIGAMDVEVNAVKNKVSDPTVAKIAGIEFVCGNIENVIVCVAQCSPGKVNAALCTQIMIDRFKADSIVNIGVGCSLSSDVVIKNIVVADSVCEYDIDITALGEPKGFVNGLNTVKIATDDSMSRALAQTAVSCGEKIHIGTVATGDTFIASQQLKDSIASEFGAICGEMEGAAIGHVCSANDVPFAVLRCISDGGDENSIMDYPTFKKIAANISTTILINYIKTLQSQIKLF